MNETNQKPLPPEALIGQIGLVRERANLVIEAELARRGIEGIVPAHGTLLVRLFGEKEGIPLKTLVEQSGRVKSTVTGMINTLVRHGYVEKRNDPHDGRVVLVRLTAKGGRLEKPFLEISSILQERTFGDMAEKDRRLLMKLLTTVGANLA